MSSAATSVPAPGPPWSRSPGSTGPFLDDGTLLKPVAVDTTVEDGADLLRTYKVKSGDTLTGIADKFGVSMMTLWWANNLNSKDELHLGQVLTIPPVTGLVLTVTANDTLDTLAAKYEVDKADIVSTNDLDDPNLVVGQVLVVPGAKGKPIPTPKPVKHATVSRSHSSGGGSTRPPVKLHRRALPLAGRRRRQLHQPVLPLRPLRHRHRRRLRLARAGAVEAARSSSPAGRATAAATRSGSPTAPACTRPTTTCRRSRSRTASTSGAASRSGGSASPATPPARTSTSRSGAAPSGMAARGSTRCPTSRPIPRNGRRREPADPVRECPRCSSTA